MNEIERLTRQVARDQRLYEALKAHDDWPTKASIAFICDMVENEYRLAMAKGERWPYSDDGWEPGVNDG